MSTSEITVDDLMRLLREVSGDAPPPDGDLLDVDFEDMGYDSVAVMEANARLAREFGRSIDLQVADEARTPRQLLELFNGAPR
ncbi:acyl carrier protein [Nocardia sp. NPDC052316]|uniref:acyl carrier protein n=1 Tax=Nocardia sp. NPDC052316 TaxID=3364329 RepID=UPI0037C50E5E